MRACNGRIRPATSAEAPEWLRVRSSKPMLRVRFSPSAPRARSSADQSTGLRNRGSHVQIVPGAPDTHQHHGSANRLATVPVLKTVRAFTGLGRSTRPRFRQIRWRVTQWQEYPAFNRRVAGSSPAVPTRPGRASSVGRASDCRSEGEGIETPAWRQTHRTSS